MTDTPDVTPHHPRTAGDNLLLAALASSGSNGNTLRKAVPAMAPLNINPIGTILSIQETSAGAVWGVAVTVQITATNEILTRFINKRVWADEDSFRADVQAALVGKPSDYNIPWTVVGTWF